MLNPWFVRNIGDIFRTFSVDSFNRQVNLGFCGGWHISVFLGERYKLYVLAASKLQYIRNHCLMKRV